MKNAPTVTVCACTYRRPDGLNNLLEGLAGQTFTKLDPPRWDIVIVDNEGSEAASQVCERFQRDCEIPLTYVHEPKRGIAHARNACLDHLPETRDFFAMIDDDEIPEPDWLDQLLWLQAATGADVVQGQVKPEFPTDVPEWITTGGFFGWPRNDLDGRPPQWKDGQALDSAASNNVLVRCAAVRRLGLRFDPELGLSGGSDAVFFRRLGLAGYTPFYASQAVVHETIPPARARLGYMLREQYKRGGLRFRKKAILKSERLSRTALVSLRFKTGLRGLGVVVSGLAATLASLTAGRLWRASLANGLLKGANGVGMLAGAFGIRYLHYQFASR